MVLVAGLAILIFFYFDIMEALGLYKPAPPLKPEVENVIDSTQSFDQSTLPTDQESLTQESQSVDTALEVGQIVSKSAPADNLSEIVNDTITIETNKYIIKMTTLGGGPVSMLLKEHTYRNGEMIEMIPDAQFSTPTASFAGGTYNTSQTNFVSSQYAGSYDATSNEFKVTYEYVQDDGSAIKKHYRFYPDTYHYDLNIELDEPQNMGLTGKYTLIWNTPLGVTEPQPKTDYDMMNAIAYQGGSLETLDDFQDDKLKESLEGTTAWAGVRSMYFSAVLIPKNRPAEAASANGVINNVSFEQEILKERLVTVGIDMPFANVRTLTDSFTVFVGPLDYHMMADYDVDLEKIMDIGTTPFVGWIIKLFAVPIMWLLPKMYEFVPNYGLVIILFAFFVKVITLPLSMKSFKSMNAMKVVQPELEKLKEKYKKDPQRMQKETMALYKKHGVNPISGCLPMLPQMPLFFAMFAVFRSTILLRDAPFVWFITDLSRGAVTYTDPYMILVIIMIGAQFLSQKLTMAGGTQQNKAIGYIMPLFMGFMFRTFASGLVLYWTCFSVFSLLDYFLFKRKELKNTNIKTA